MDARHSISRDVYTGLQAEHIRTADEILAALLDLGVDRVFGIPGGTISPLYDALIDAKVDLVTCQHETMAVYMATGYSRGTGKPGVVLVTSGPGVLNTVTGVAAAKMDEVPILVFAGEVPTKNNARGVLQDGGASGLDVIQVMQPITKAAQTLNQPERARSLVHEATQLAMRHPRGPVFIRLPIDITVQTHTTVKVSQSLVSQAAPDEAVCQEIGERLIQANRPVIFVGVGAKMANASRSLRELAEWVRVPVIMDVEAKGLLPESHPLSLGLFGVGEAGAARSYLEDGADFILMLGARLDDTTTAGFSSLLRPEEGEVVQIDHNPARLCRGYRPDLAIACDLAQALERIQAEIAPPSAAVMLDRDKAIRRARKAMEPAIVPTLKEAPHDPRAVIRALQALFGRQAIFTSDIGNHLLHAARHLIVDEPGAFHVSNGLGGMGSGIGMAIGLALANKGKRPVISICGDGGILMVGNEIATCAKYKIPVVFAVLNDGQLGMVEHGNENVFGRSAFCESPKVDFVSLAKALGADAMDITTTDDLKEAVSRFGDGPLLLNIPIDPNVRASNPREAGFKNRAER